MKTYIVTLPDSTTTNVVISGGGGTRDDAADYVCGLPVPDASGAQFPDLLAPRMRRIRVSALTIGLYGVWCLDPDRADPNPRGPSFLVSSGLNPPTVTGVSPGTGSTAGGTHVTVSGSGFSVPGGVFHVRFGGVDATGVIVSDDGHLTCDTPAHVAGAVDVTVTTVAGTGTDPGAFTYANPWPITGAIHAWRADMGVHLTGPNVTQWDDQVGSFNLPGGGLASPVNPPTFAASSIGGQPAIRFAGPDEGFNAPAGINPGQALPYMLIYVAVAQAGSTGFAAGMFESMPSNSQLEFRMHDNLSEVIEFNSFQNITESPVTNTNPHVLAFDMRNNAGGGWKMFDNAHTQVGANANTINAGDITGTSPFIVGNSPGGGNQFVGDIAELLIVDPTVFDLNAYLTYINAHYGIPIGP